MRVAADSSLLSPRATPRLYRLLSRLALTLGYMRVLLLLLLPVCVLGEPWPYPMEKRIIGDLLYLANPAYGNHAGLSFESVGWKSDLLDQAFERYSRILSDPSMHMEYEMNVDIPEDLMDSDTRIEKVVVYVQSYDQTLDVYTSETYSLRISAPAVVIQSQTVYGAIRALETLSQSCHVIRHVKTDGYTHHHHHHSRDGAQNVIVLNETAIYDSPRFRHRGLLIDTARHYLPLYIIKTHMDAMVMTKMNVLHWHISDDESFPYVSQSVPELANAGSFSPDMQYTDDMVEDIVQYGNARGIRVIVEFDSPGHTGAISKSHPEIMASCPHGSPPTLSPAYNPYDIVWRVFRDMSRVFPDRAMHFGGDEINLECWRQDETTHSWMKDKGFDVTLAVEHHVKRIMEFAQAMGRIPILYNDLYNLLPKDTSVLPPTTVVHVWSPIGSDHWQQELKRVTKNHRAILSSPWYLDHATRGIDSWRDFWSIDPLEPYSRSSPDQKDRVLGGEAMAWGEHVDATNAISSTWPLAAAVGERLWSPSSLQDIEDATRRMFRIRCRMIARGIDASPTQSGECPLISVENHVLPHR
jgi:hexosaminidase